MVNPLTVYVQRGCLFSDEALAWLAAHAVPFIEKDISDPTVLADLENFETIVTPTFVVGDEIIYGFDADRLTELLTPSPAHREDPRPGGQSRREHPG